MCAVALLSHLTASCTAWVIKDNQPRAVCSDSQVWKQPEEGGEAQGSCTTCRGEPWQQLHVKPTPTHTRTHLALHYNQSRSWRSVDASLQHTTSHALAIHRPTRVLRGWSRSHLLTTHTGDVLGAPVMAAMMGPQVPQALVLDLVLVLVRAARPPVGGGPVAMSQTTSRSSCTSYCRSKTS